MLCRPGHISAAPELPLRLDRQRHHDVLQDGVPEVRVLVHREPQVPRLPTPHRLHVKGSHVRQMQVTAKTRVSIGHLGGVSNETSVACARWAAVAKGGDQV